MGAEIQASMLCKQKTEARDAAHLLELLLSGRFPRLWRPTMSERDLRQLVWHRQKLVWMCNDEGKSEVIGDRRDLETNGSRCVSTRRCLPSKPTLRRTSALVTEWSQ
jgi:hypothetical protein